MLLLWFTLFCVGSCLKCFREYDDTAYPIGSTYVVQDAFTRRCTVTNGSWSWLVVNCLIDGVEIPVNGSRTIGDITYGCPQRNNQTERTREPAVTARCEGIHESGSTWIADRNLELRCTEYGRVELIGCLTHTGQHIKPNKTTTIGRMQFDCYLFSNGSLRYAPNAATDPNVCLDPTTNTDVPNWDMYHYNGYLNRCVNGKPEIFGCQPLDTDVDSFLIPVGQTEEKDGVRHSCMLESDGVIRHRTEQIDSGRILFKD